MRHADTFGLDAAKLPRTGRPLRKVVQLAILAVCTGAILTLSPSAPASAASCWYSAASISGQSVTKKGRAKKQKWACNRARRKCNRARDRSVRKGANPRGFKCVRVK